MFSLSSTIMQQKLRMFKEKQLVIKTCLLLADYSDVKQTYLDLKLDSL